MHLQCAYFKGMGGTNGSSQLLILGCSLIYICNNSCRRYHHEPVDPLTRPSPDHQVLHTLAITYPDPSSRPDCTAQREPAAPTHARLGSRRLRQDHLTR